MVKIPFRYLELLILPVSEVLQYLKETNLNLLIECKEYSEKFYALVAEHLRQYAIADRTIIFAFPEIAGGISLFGYFYYKGGVTITIDGIILVTVLLVFLILPLLGLGIKKRFNFKLFWGVFSLSTLNYETALNLVFASTRSNPEPIDCHDGVPSRNDKNRVS